MLLAAQLDEEFTAWWAILPVKVGKIAARKEYEKARRIASAEAILEGTRRYIATKPDWQKWCHPTTFLREGRWLDEVNAPARKVAGSLQNWWDE